MTDAGEGSSGPKPSQESSSQVNGAPARVNPPVSSTTEASTMPSITITNNTRTSAHNTRGDRFGGLDVAQIRQGIADLTLYPRLSEVNPANPRTRLPPAGLAFTLRSSSLGRHSSTDPHAKENSSTLSPASIINQEHSPTKPHSQIASRTQLPSKPGPSSDGDPGQIVNKGSAIAVTQKSSVLGGDLTASKYATDSFVPAITSREPSTFSLLSERLATSPSQPPRRRPRVGKSSKTSHSSKASGSQAPTRSLVPAQTPAPRPLVGPTPQNGLGQAPLASTSSRNASSFAPSYHQAPVQHKPLREMPGFTGSGLQTGSRMDKNTAFGHDLSSQAPNKSKPQKGNSSQPFVLPPAFVPQQFPSNSQTTPLDPPLDPGKDAMNDLIPAPYSHGGRFRISPVNPIKGREEVQGTSANDLKKALDNWAPGRQPISRALNITQTPKKEAKTDKVGAKVAQTAHDQQQLELTPQSILQPYLAKKGKGSEQHQTQASSQDSPNGRSDHMTEADKAKLRSAHGDKLEKLLEDKWDGRTKDKMDSLEIRHREDMAKLEHGLTAATEEKLSQLKKKHAKQLEEKEMALKSELARLTETLEQIYQEEKDALTAKHSEASREQATKHQAELVATRTSLNYQSNFMMERLKAGIQRYVEELGSKEGMNRMAERLFPGAEHGDPADDLIVHHKRTSKQAEKLVVDPKPDNQESTKPTTNTDPIPPNIPSASSTISPADRAGSPTIAGSTASSGSPTEAKDPSSHVPKPLEHKSDGSSNPVKTQDKLLTHGLTDGSRRVSLMNVPSGASAKTVTSLVWGGSIEAIDFVAGTHRATISFLCQADCAAYLKEAGARIKYQPEGQLVADWIFVRGDHGIDPITSELKSYIDDGMTRCLKIEGLDDGWTVEGLKEKFAVLRGEAVEHIYEARGEDEERIVHVRLCKIQDAVGFMAELVWNSELGDPKVYFDQDPCARATGVHYD